MYTLWEQTGSYLVDNELRITGPEHGRILSRHRTLAGALRAQRYYLREYRTRTTIMDKDRNPVPEEHHGY